VRTGGKEGTKEMTRQGRLIVEEGHWRETMIFDACGIFLIEGRLVHAFKERLALGRNRVRTVDQVWCFLSLTGPMHHRGILSSGTNRIPAARRQ